MLDLLFLLALWAIILISLVFMPIPIGNENSTVRRLPYITFGIMAINVVVYFATLPSTVEQDKEWTRTKGDLVAFVEIHGELMADSEVRDKLKEVGFLTKHESEKIGLQYGRDAEVRKEYESWLRGPEASKLRVELDQKLIAFKAACESSLYYQYGLAPNGNWKFYQLITCAFIHGSRRHLFGNLIFFFAVAFSLEDLWGRSIFLVFYLLAAMAASLPNVINPIPVPAIGASGAISATMGAFLLRLPKTKIKIRWLSLPLAPFFLVFGKKPFGRIFLPAYVYFPFYFGSQVLYWWFNTKYEQVSSVDYSAHIAGFVFGLAFAGLLKATRTEEKYIHPKIEAKVSFSASPAVTHALECLDRGDIDMAERRLKAHLAKDPDDVNALMGLIQVYQRTLNYTQLNRMYSRLIRYHLARNDKEAALYAYDGLLSCFPDNEVDVRIPVRDWLALCEYLKESEMGPEAAVEYERLATAYPEDALAVRACVQGGEAALATHDNERALRLFEKARTMNPPSPLVLRIEAGIEKCSRRITNRPTWVKETPEPPVVSKKDVDEKNLPW